MVVAIELSDLASALGLGDHELVSFVGGGGKTTFVFALGRQLPGRVVLTTTTKMGTDRTDGRPVLFAPTAGELDAALARDRCVIAWGADGGHKALGVEPGVADAWFDRVDHVVVEADGSRRRPFKAPAPHEPVVPTRSTVVGACVGADALGRVIADQCHRPLRVAALAGCSAYERLDPVRAATVLAHPDGGRRDVPAGARFVVVVNRVGPGSAALVDDLVGELAARSIDTVVVAEEAAGGGCTIGQ